MTSLLDKQELILGEKRIPKGDLVNLSADILRV